MDVAMAMPFFRIMNHPIERAKVARTATRRRITFLFSRRFVPIDSVALTVVVAAVVVVVLASRTPFDVRSRHLERLCERRDGPIVLPDFEAKSGAVVHFLNPRVD
jgi:hypothetical protein